MSLDLSASEEAFSVKLGSALTMERKLLELLGELEHHAQRGDIKRALLQHREETRLHVINLERCFKLLGAPAGELPCPVIAAVAADAGVTIRVTAAPLRDAILLAAASEAEQYEIAIYETLISEADAIGASEAAGLMRHNLEQDKRALDASRSALRGLVAQGTPSPTPDRPPVPQN